MKRTIVLCIALFIFPLTTLADKYTFKEDWFSQNIPTWEKVFTEQQLKGRPKLKYIEVGVWEGRSFFWMLDNVLTDEKSEAIAVDIFPPHVKENFNKNLKASGAKKKVTIREGRSEEQLRTLPSESYDIIYIDGAHTAKHVMIDAVQAWRLLKRGGLLIFDDYKWRPELQADARPQPAIDTFLLAYGGELDVIERGYQLIVKKKAYPCNEYFCYVIGPYMYDFYAKTLYRVADTSKVDLSAEEIKMLEESVTKRRLSYDTNLPIPKKNKKAFQLLLKKLKL